LKDYIEHYRRDGDYFDYNQEMSKGRVEVERRRGEAILSVLKSLTGGVVLDIGSGSGKLVKSIAQRGFTLFPVDLSYRNLFGLNHINKIYPVLADGYHLPFAKNSFDAVILSSILEHCEKSGAMLSEANYILRPGGLAIVVTPYKERIVYHQCIHCNKLTPAYAHLQSFDENKLGEIFQSSGLEEIKWFVFANKGLDVCRLNILLSFLPYRLWRIFDSPANYITKKAEYILMMGVKKG